MAPTAGGGALRLRTDPGALVRMAGR